MSSYDVDATKDSAADPPGTAEPPPPPLDEPDEERRLTRRPLQGFERTLTHLTKKPSGSIERPCAVPVNRSS